MTVSNAFWNRNTASCALLALAMISANGEALRAQTPAPVAPPPAYWKWAATPPMGWNSYDAFGASVTEAEALANADYMKQHLRTHGWEYVILDFRWYDPDALNHLNGAKGEVLTMDEYGRLLPAPNRFPSAADGAGFKALAVRIHAMGLKFGFHIMRGIPRQAVTANTPIEGSAFHAADAADTSNTCGWCPDMYGVRGDTPAGRAYYASLFRLYASWGVDFVKVDDFTSPYHAAEGEAIRLAIDQCGHPIVFSGSPGETSINAANQVSTHTNMWRISRDFWDAAGPHGGWPALYHHFELASRWQGVAGPGHWPDMDMIPIGRLGVRSLGPDRQSKFTADEQRTLMTLWCITRSPLMLGADLPDTEPTTLALLTTDAALAVNQHSTNNRQLFRNGDLIAWTADAPNGRSKYLAVFNAPPPALMTPTAPAPTDAQTLTAPVPVLLADLGFARGCRIYDIWTGQKLGVASGTFTPTISSHGAGFYRLDPK